MILFLELKTFLQLMCFPLLFIHMMCFVEIPCRILAMAASGKITMKPDQLSSSFLACWIWFGQRSCPIHSWDS